MRYWSGLLLLLLAGCASTKAPERRPSLNQVYMHMAHHQEREPVQRAYREAVRQMGFEVLEEEPGRIRALHSEGSVPTSLTVTFSPGDTLATEVRVVSDYVFRGEQFTHYPYELAYEAHEVLTGKRALPYVYPQASYPEGARGCEVPVPENPQEVVSPGGAQTMTRFKRHLRYSDEARRNGIEGRVYVAAAVSEAGQVTCAIVIAGLPGGLNERAIEALVKTRFEPFLYRGQPVAMRIVMPITFRLN